MIWQEQEDGFFSRENLSEAIKSKLQMLILEATAQISFENFFLSEEVAELLNAAN